MGSVWYFVKKKFLCEFKMKNRNNETKLLLLVQAQGLPCMQTLGEGPSTLCFHEPRRFGSISVRFLKLSVEKEKREQKKARGTVFTATTHFLIKS